MTQATLKAEIIKVLSPMSLKEGDEVVVFNGMILGKHKEASESLLREPDACPVNEGDIISAIRALGARATGHAIGTQLNIPTPLRGIGAGNLRSTLRGMARQGKLKIRHPGGVYVVLCSQWSLPNQADVVNGAAGH